MRRPCTLSILTAMLTTLFGLVGVAMATPTSQTFVTTITINTTEDLDDSLSTTCTSAPDGRCSLRRALIEASGLGPAERPVLIRFALSTLDPNYERDAPQTWTLMVNRGALPPLRTPSILDIDGRVTIDGATQPGGRANGPKIFVNLGDQSLEIESENNVLRNLAFIVMGSIVLKEGDNLVENNWMGLGGDGQTLRLRAPGAPSRLAIGGGVSIRSDGNIVRGNTIAGAFSAAIAIDNGEGNLVTANNIGTRADGTVPHVPEAGRCIASFSFDPQNWYGGWGIRLNGSNNTVLDNRIVGLQNMRAVNDTVPIALEIFGTGHHIRGNIVGLDADDPEDDPTGVCGQGIKVSGSANLILDNTIARSHTSLQGSQGGPLNGAILFSDNSLTPGGIAVRRNRVIDGPGNIYVFGPEAPQALRTFRPARISQIDGVTVRGSNGHAPDGSSSSCPNCLIDFYLDNTDANAEALAYLGSTVADAGGNFIYTLSQPLAPGTGIRTSSTSASAGIIGTLAISTTTRFSGLYIDQAQLLVEGPVIGSRDETYNFTAHVFPASLAVPITYTVEITDYSRVVYTSDSTSVSVPLKWSQTGAKTITVAADNGLANATATHTILIGNAAIYLPLVRQ